MAQIGQLMAQLGRNGDTMMAHVTPGEFVIPKSLLDNEPQLMSAIIKAFNGHAEKTGERMDWRRFMVGAPQGPNNPATGAEEFFTGESGADDAANAAAAADAAAAAASGDVGAGPSGAAQTYSGIGGGAGSASVDANIQGVPGLDPTVALDPGFAAPNDPSNPGISAPTAAQDEAQNSMSPGAGATSNIGEFDTPLGKVTTFDFLDLVNPLPSYAMRGIAEALGRGATAMGITGGISGPASATGIDSGGLDGDVIRGLSPARQELVREVQNRFNRPAETPVPSSLALAGSMSPLQQRTAIATRATQGDDSVYRSEEAKNYYRNLLQRSLIGPGGALGDYGDILPVESQYLRQVLGLSYKPTTESVLNAIAQA